jgi:hypothetical protein
VGLATSFGSSSVVKNEYVMVPVTIAWQDNPRTLTY